MKALKEIFNKQNIKKFSQVIAAADKNFDSAKFLQVATKNLDQLELKARVKLIADALFETLPKDYPKALKILVKSLAPEDLESDSWNGPTMEGLNGFHLWPVTQYIEDHGVEDFDLSMEALALVTKRFTAEFAVRKFLNHNPKKAFAFFERWSKDKCTHLRRLSSEGIRPNLPWGQKVAYIHQNLKLNIPLLMTLFNDESEYVRRSVANHLNDISKLDEKLFLDTIKKLKRSDKNQMRIASHASRSLLKKGHTEVLKISGYHPPEKLKAKFILAEKKINEGAHLNFAMNLQNDSTKPQTLLLHLHFFYPRQNGKFSKKTFFLKKVKLAKKESFDFKKKHHFKKVTTRKHYPGQYRIELVANGKTLAETSFQLKP